MYDIDSLLSDLGEAGRLNIVRLESNHYCFYLYRISSLLFPKYSPVWMQFYLCSSSSNTSLRRAPKIPRGIITVTAPAWPPTASSIAFARCIMSDPSSILYLSRKLRKRFEWNCEIHRGGFADTVRMDAAVIARILNATLLNLLLNFSRASSRKRAPRAKIDHWKHTLRLINDEYLN